MIHVTDVEHNVSSDALMSTDYKQLTAWQRAMELVQEVYRCTRAFPRDEIYGITSQMRKAAVSVPSNIAEGKGRFSRKELIQFLYKARGSLMELETQIRIARNLNYLDELSSRALSAQTVEVTRILNGLINRFQQELSA